MVNKSMNVRGRDKCPYTLICMCSLPEESKRIRGCDCKSVAVLSEKKNDEKHLLGSKLTPCVPFPQKTEPFFHKEIKVLTLWTLARCCCMLFGQQIHVKDVFTVQFFILVQRWLALRSRQRQWNKIKRYRFPILMQHMLMMAQHCPYVKKLYT